MHYILCDLENKAKVNKTSRPRKILSHHIFLPLTLFDFKCKWYIISYNHTFLRSSINDLSQCLGVCQGSPQGWTISSRHTPACMLAVWFFVRCHKFNHCCIRFRIWTFFNNSIQFEGWKRSTHRPFGTQRDCSLRMTPWKIFDNKWRKSFKNIGRFWWIMILKRTQRYLY